MIYKNTLNLGIICSESLWNVALFLAMLPTFASSQIRVIESVF